MGNEITSKFINPFSDAGFKRLFGQEESKPVLLGFLNALLDGERHITDLEYRDKEQLGIRNDEDRSSIYDIYCELENGEHIIVEMQNRPQPYFKDLVRSDLQSDRSEYKDFKSD